MGHAIGTSACDQGKEGQFCFRWLGQGPLDQEPGTQAHLELLKPEHQQRTPACEVSRSFEMELECAELDAVVDSKAGWLGAGANRQGRLEAAKQGCGWGHRRCGSLLAPQLIQAPVGLKGFRGQATTLLAAQFLCVEQVCAVGKPLLF